MSKEMVSINVFLNILLIIASISAFIFSAILLKQLFVKIAKKRIRENAMLITDDSDCKRKKFDLSNIALSEMIRQTTNLSLDDKKFIAKGIFSKHKDLEELILLSGLSAQISVKGVLNARLYLALYLAIGFFVAGFLFSSELAFIGLFSGIVTGFSAPKRVLKSRSKQRGESLEKHLPQMLDVVSIGMRSGLSFDRSLQIYGLTFQSNLSREFMVAQKMWLSGLKSREDSLRNLSKSYDSQVFSRMIESILRSLKLGTSMVETLSASASESRAIYRERREEKVRKAPIKMMIPTGTLILPAMLILVLGPVLLQLMSGGGF